MNLRTPFINEYGRLRSGWRLLVFAILFVAVETAAELLLFHFNLRNLPHGFYILELVRRGLLLASALFVGFFCTRFLEGLPWKALGLTFHHKWFWDFVVGTVVGCLTLALGVLICFAGRGYQFSLPQGDLFFSIAKSLVGSGLLFLVAALAEEAIFRGYPLQTFARAHLIALGIFLTSVPFGIGHLWNPNVVRGVTFANTVLAGAWLAIAYLRTRSLWLPLGVHWSWNWALGSVFGLPVSGLKLLAHTPIETKDLGPAWLTGGSYGIEAGVASTIVLILSSLFLWKTRLVSTTPELLRLTSEEKPAHPLSLPLDNQQVDHPRLEEPLED